MASKRGQPRGNAASKRPMRIVDEEDDAPSLPKEPETVRGSKFLQRTGHGTSNSSTLSPADFNIRIHKCLAQAENDQFRVGEPTGNYKIAVSTPMGPKENRGKWLPIYKDAVDTARLGQRIQYVLASPSWDSLHFCDMHHSRIIVPLNRVAKRTFVQI